MAQATLKKCCEPGCNTLVRGVPRCPSCEAKKPKRVRNGPSDQFYATPAWRKLRNRFIKLHPLCVDCEAEGRITASYIVDHVIERKDDPNRELDWDNLAGLCLQCHNKKSARERARRNR